MIGLIQKVLVDTIREQGGESALQKIAADAGVTLHEAFRIDRDYPDDECLRLIAATASYFKMDEDSLYQLYADRFVRTSRTLFPRFYQMAASAREFIERQPRIHAILASSLASEESRGRVRDKFEVAPCGDDLLVNYRSPNRLCGLYKALYQRILAEYGDTGSFEIQRCQKRGDPVCTFCLKMEPRDA